MNKVTIVGSINLDTTLYLQRVPEPGETIRIQKLITSGGGKGANQAIAAQRLGAKVAFIGAVGTDDVGQQMLNLLRAAAINVDGIAQLADHTTGQAFITVDEQGENRIMINAGANTAFTPEQVRQSQPLITTSDFLIAQFETELKSTLEAFSLAKKAGVKTILNPAPAIASIPPELLALTDIIVPNETEAEILTGVHVHDEKSAQLAATKLADSGVSIVVITLGKAGVYYQTASQQGLIPALRVKAIDTTAAGDTFIGALASVLQPDFSNLTEALLFGNQASAITVQRLGAQDAIPFKDEITPD